MKLLNTIFLTIIFFEVLAQQSGKLIPYRKGDKFGYINEKGEVKIPFQYKDAGIFLGGLAWVKKKNRFGYIDTDGRMVIKPKFTVAGNFSGGSAYVKKKFGKSYEIGKRGRQVINIECGARTPAEYSKTWYLQGFKQEGKYGVLNRDNKDTLVFPKYDSAHYFETNGWVRISIDKKWGLVYLDKEVVSPKYDKTGNFIHPTSNGDLNVEITWVILNGNVGWIDKRGEEIIKPVYETSDLYFNNGLTRVKYKGKWGYIDEIGKKYFD